ncbi:hypothetical protein [Cellulomonas wangsupingiae]|uniref:hypothetical protein n=1 Tax=Cellulomonas wangsupingiae TaxID=2968085 RepID=UPI001D0E570B|nr:hypothetical protein [Cellulomonas wangsupingiae]MCM0641147.1 hypothetical protein [Cellulomonas wangsupingiae]
MAFAPDDGASALDDSRWWTASGYVAPSTSGTSAGRAPRIVLDPAARESSSGPAADWTTPFSVDVVTDGGSYGGVADENDVRALEGLDDSAYIVDGVVMTERQLLEAEGSIDCPEPSSGTTGVGLR